MTLYYIPYNDLMRNVMLKYLTDQITVLPKSFDMRRNDAKLRVELLTDEVPQDHPIYGLFWQKEGK